MTSTTPIPGPRSGHPTKEIAVAEQTASTETCREAWPTGVNQGLDVPCEREVGHRGWHRSEADGVKWSGKMNARERRALTLLRETWVR